MFNRKLYLGIALLGMVALLASCATNSNGMESPSESTDSEAVGDATEARDVALNHLRVHKDQDTPSEGAAWEEVDVTPPALIGAATKQFTYDSWIIRVSYPVVLPENTVYQATVLNTDLGWQWKGSVKADGTVTEVSGLKQMTKEESQRIAEEFLRSSPTFAFDGIPDTLKLADTSELSDPYSWTFVFEFESLHAGYGDRTGQVLAQVITPHQASITVEQLEIKYATIDGVWDMIAQE